VLAALVALIATGAGIWVVAVRQSSIARRLRAFTPDALSDRGRRGYEALLVAELVEDTFRSWTWAHPDATYGLLALWDEPAELSTQALLAVCERGSPAGRFYALAGLSQSDPWTFERARTRYGHYPEEVEMMLGCFHYSGTSDELLVEHVVDGSLAEGWRELWSRTEPSGPELERALPE